jgi:hypothetical protein
MSITMTVKTTGAVWNLFYADKTAWPEGSYHDDTLLAINGKEDPDGELEKLQALLRNVVTSPDYQAGGKVLATPLN